MLRYPKQYNSNNKEKKVEVSLHKAGLHTLHRLEQCATLPKYKAGPCGWAQALVGAVHLIKPSNRPAWLDWES